MHSFSNVKNDATTLDVYNVTQTLALLYGHTLYEVIKRVNTKINQ